MTQILSPTSDHIVNVTGLLFTADTRPAAAGMDALNLFRNAVTATRLPIPTTSSDPSSEPSPSELAEATHLYFAVPSPHCLPLDNITRFTQSSGDQIDLRSIYLAYLCKDDAPQEYLQKFTDLNAKLPAGQQAKHLNFVEKLELVSWLDGAEGTEFVKPLEATADDVTAAGKNWGIRTAATRDL